MAASLPRTLALGALLALAAGRGLTADAPPPASTDPASANPASTDPASANPSSTDSGAATGRAASRDLPVSLDAASSEVDYRTNTVNFRDVVISQGGMRVAAESARATGLNFENATWNFRGNVRITVNGGSLRSDEAKVDFAANRIARATISGSPAQFEQKRAETTELARGRAGLIVYDVPTGTVKLTQDAWLTDGRNDISGQELVYNVREQRVQAETKPGNTDRVRITIRPRDTGAAP